ncbi:MAG: protein kinase [Polyangiaceae bacterium]|nr:protein kinase [Polyangiaceae bacterium]
MTRKRDAPHRVLAGKYELLRQVGKGGMATVWRARQRGAAGFSRVVAVKRMLIDLASDPASAELFIEEARVGSQLAHPNIVEVLDFGQDEEGGYYLVLDWVDGIDLLDYMRSFHQAKRHMPWQAVAAVATQALHGLAAAHERVDDDGAPRPVVHRDVTPSNVMIGRNGVVKLADFGLARAADRLTRTLPNIIKGKLAYTAPELTRGGRASVSSDVFAMGVTLWEALAGRRMFAGTTPQEIISNIAAWRIPSLKLLRPDLPSAVVTVVEGAIVKDPVARTPSARAMLDALTRALRGLADEVDATRLSASVIAAKARLEQMDASLERELSIDDDPLSASVEISVDFENSPSARRASARPGSFADEAPTVPRVAVRVEELPPAATPTLKSPAAKGAPRVEERAPPPVAVERAPATKRPIVKSSLASSTRLPDKKK